MGGRRLEALALLGLGIRRMSITPAAVGPIKELVGKVDLAEITAAMAGWIAAPPRDMRAAMIAWAAERDIHVD
jgi:phosphotransferase system enzyme I (PtsP)